MSVERVADQVLYMSVDVRTFQKENVTATETCLTSVERVADQASQKEIVIATGTYSMSVELVVEQGSLQAIVIATVTC